MPLFGRPKDPPSTERPGPLDPFWQYVLNDPDDNTTLDSGREIPSTVLSGVLGNIMEESDDDSSTYNERPFASRFFRADDGSTDDDDDDTTQSSWGYPSRSAADSTAVSSVGTSTLVSATKQRVPLEGFWGYMLGERDGDNDGSDEPSVDTSDEDTLEESIVGECTTENDNRLNTGGITSEASKDLAEKKQPPTCTAKPSVGNNPNHRKWNSSQQQQDNNDEGVETTYQPGVQRNRQSWISRVSCNKQKRLVRKESKVETSWVGMLGAASLAPMAIQSSKAPNKTKRRFRSRLFTAQAKPESAPDNRKPMTWPIELDMDALAMSKTDPTKKDIETIAIPEGGAVPGQVEKKFSAKSNVSSILPC